MTKWFLTRSAGIYWYNNIINNNNNDNNNNNNSNNNRAKRNVLVKSVESVMSKICPCLRQG